MPLLSLSGAQFTFHLVFLFCSSLPPNIVTSVVKANEVDGEGRALVKGPLKVNECQTAWWTAKVSSSNTHWWGWFQWEEQGGGICNQFRPKISIHTELHPSKMSFLEQTLSHQLFWWKELRNVFCAGVWEKMPGRQGTWMKQMTNAMCQEIIYHLVYILDVYILYM